MYGSIDISPAFLSACMNNFPEAKIVLDKFHLVKWPSESLDGVRKKEHKSRGLLKGINILS